MNMITAVLIANLSIIFISMILFYKSWLDQIRPDWFYIFRIHEHDFSNCKEVKLFLPLKGKKDAYTIDGFDYDKSGHRAILDSKNVYTWNFEKGKNKPVSFQVTENVDAKLIAEAKKISLDDIWFGSGGIEDFLKTWGVVIIGLLLLTVIGYFFMKNGEETRLTQQILINLSRRGN